MTYAPLSDPTGVPLARPLRGDVRSVRPPAPSSSGTPSPSRDPAAFKVPVKDLVQYGASPRATLALAQAARAKAFLDGRGFVVPQDVKDVAPAVLRHRLGLSYEAEALEKTSDDVVRALLEHVPVP